TRNVVRDVRQVFRRNQPELRTSLWGTPWNWLGLGGLGLAAAIIIAAIITLNLVPRLQRPGADQFLATQLIASHVRSLMANHLTDVADSDFNYWAVSDVNANDLQTFKQQFELQTSHH